MPRRIREWEAGLFRRLLRRRLLALLAVLALQAVLVASLGVLLWSTRVKDTIVGYAQAAETAGHITVSLSQRDVGKLEAGRTVMVTLEPQGETSSAACGGEVTSIRGDADPYIATIKLAQAAGPLEAEPCAAARHLLEAGKPTRVTLEARTRRLLALLLGG